MADIIRADSRVGRSQNEPVHRRLEFTHVSRPRVLQQKVPCLWRKGLLHYVGLVAELAVRRGREVIRLVRGADSVCSSAGLLSLWSLYASLFMPPMVLRPRPGIPALDVAWSRIAAAICSSDHSAGRATLHRTGPRHPHACAMATVSRQSACRSTRLSSLKCPVSSTSACSGLVQGTELGNTAASLADELVHGPESLRPCEPPGAHHDCRSHSGRVTQALDRPARVQ